MNYETAKAEIIAYLKQQDNEYFRERNTTKNRVLADERLIDVLASEHLHCVMSFGNKPEWSCKDACDNNPGIVPPDDFLIVCDTVDDAAAKIMQVYKSNDLCIGELFSSIVIQNLSIEEVVKVYAKLYQEIEGDEICRIDEDGLRYSIGT